MDEHQIPVRRAKPKTIAKSKIIIVVLSLLVCIGFGTAVYFYLQSKKPDASSAQTQQQQTARAVEVKNKVAKLISVPADETPTLATVTDEKKLADQPFFKEAKNGDLIVIFPQAKKAIVYRESENKLINVGPIAITGDKSKP